MNYYGNLLHLMYRQCLNEKTFDKLMDYCCMALNDNIYNIKNCLTYYYKFFECQYSETHRLV